MPTVYRITRAGLKLLYKVRHHRGHGIHSTFVFNLINKVIEERTPYYAYEDVNHYLDTQSSGKLHMNKYNRLSFRLVNHFDTKNILEIGSNKGVNTISITAHSSEIRCTSFEPNEKYNRMACALYTDWNRHVDLQTMKIPSLLGEYDAIFVDLNSWRQSDAEYLTRIFNHVHAGSFIVVKGIRTNRRHQALWKMMIDNQQRTAVLDMFNLGIIFFNKQLYRWKYQISF